MLLPAIQMFSSPLLRPPTLPYPQPHESNTISKITHPSPPKFPSHKSFGLHRLSMCASSSHDSSLSPDTSSEGFNADLGRLLALLPDEMRLRICVHKELDQLVELVLDLGRPPLARFPSGDFVLSNSPVTFQDIEFAACQVGDFAVDNRAGISRTLHRISAIRNRKGAIIGLTCRVGRVISGSANLLRDLVQHGASLLLIGPPGVGKTTIIREIARILANDYNKRVMIVDTSNEIGGDGDIPHPGIGSARRMQVPNSDMQHKVLIEAIENHMPQVIVIDEIGTKLEAMAARTIAQRGIQLVATAHGIKIENLIMNPSLEMLVGGIQSVTLGDEEASRRGKQKTVLERKGASTFSSGIEIVSKAELRVHHSLEATVDAILSGRRPYVEVRRVDSTGLEESVPREIQTHNFSNRETEMIDKNIQVMRHGNAGNGEVISELNSSVNETPFQAGVPPFFLFLYGINEASVIEGIKQLKLEGVVEVTNNISKANAVLALQSKLKKNTKIQASADSHDIPLYAAKMDSSGQITKAIKSLLREHEDGLKIFDSKDKIISSEKTDALEEARIGVEQKVIGKGECVELIPRPPYILSLQIQLARKYHFQAEIIGSDMDARVCILPLPIITTPDAAAASTHSNHNDAVNRLPLLPE